MVHYERVTHKVAYKHYTQRTIAHTHMDGIYVIRCNLSDGGIFVTTARNGSIYRVGSAT